MPDVVLTLTGILTGSRERTIASPVLRDEKNRRLG
jgi:hypothetical protein